jgi:hypothetical protein
MTSLVAVRLGARAAAWTALGFDVRDGTLRLANGMLRFDEQAPSGIVALMVDDDRPDHPDRPVEVDGLAFERGFGSGDDGDTACELDHVVVMTDSLERTSAAVEATLGLECRRIRDTGQVRQAFHRFADPPAGATRGCILEIVENERVPTPQFWGLVITVDGLDALCGANPDLISLPKPAVQPGRRIATARREADLGTAVAFMSA